LDLQRVFLYPNLEWTHPKRKYNTKIKTLVENTNDTTDEVLINSTVLKFRYYYCSVGGAMASWLKCLTPEQAVQV